MKLAKQFLDVGLFTNNLEPMLAFWQREIGLPFEEALPTGGGTVQHRHALNGGVLKINHSRDPLPDSRPAGYRELLIVRPGLSQPAPVVDPDGNHVTLLPPGDRGVNSLAVVIQVSSLDNARRYYRDALGMAEGEPGVLTVGESAVLLQEDPSVQRALPCEGAATAT